MSKFKLIIYAIVGEMSLACSFSTLWVPCTNSIIIILVFVFSYVIYLGLHACFQ